MKGTKIKHLLASALLILPLALQVFSGAATTVNAADAANPSTKIEITKLAFTSDPGDIIPSSTDGKEINPADIGAKTQPGVEFTVYDATKEWNGAEGDDADTIQSKMTTLSSGVQDGSISGLTVAKDTDGKDAKHTTDANGNIDLSLYDYVQKDGQATSSYAVYVIVETNASGATMNGQTESITKTAAPIVLVMPLKAAGDNNKNTVHIYPKNVYGETLSKDLAADAKGKNQMNADSKASANAIGDNVPFEVTVTVPQDVAKVATFGFTDTPTEGLKDNVSTLSDLSAVLKEKNKDDVSVDLKTIATASESTEAGTTTDTGDADTQTVTPGLTTKGDGFTLAFNPTTLAQYAGKTLVIKYTAKITKDLLPDATVTNTVGTLGNNPYTFTSQTPITTGGAKFVKTDATNGDKLGGAEFIIAKKYSDGTYKYGHKDKGAVAYTWVSDKSEATPVPSSTEDATKGTFSFTGLAYSAALKDPTSSEYDKGGFATYVAIETKAPAGYALKMAETEFTVSASSYLDENVTTIKDTPRGLLPSTGGMGIYIVIAVGLAIALAGVAFMRRGKHHEEV